MITVDRNSTEGTLFSEINDYGWKNLSVRTINRKHIYSIFYCLYFNKDGTVQFDKSRKNLFSI